MLTVSAIATYLASIGVTAPVLPGSLIDTAGYGDEAIFVTSVPGGGLLLEGASDVQNFQFRFRGAQGAPDVGYEATEAFARDVDSRLVNAAYPTEIDGVAVIRLWRTGGPPSYLASESRRAHFTSGYLFESATT